MAPDPREDVAVFAERVLRQPLWPHQLEAARAAASVTTIAAARRTGKTTLVETLAIWTAFRERNVVVVILSAGQDSARRVTESIGSTLTRSDLLRGSVVDDFATRIRLTNGSEIVSLPASQRQVRGYGRGVKLLVIDEAGFVEEDLWRAARYVVLDERGSGSRILLCGTPWGGPELFFRREYEAGVDGSADHSSHHWTFEANPNLDRGYLERERDRTAPAEYAAEVLGEWSDASGSLFPRSLLESCAADIELPATLGELQEPARPMLGLDWGVSFDRSAAVAIYRLPVGELNPDAEWAPRFVVVPFIWAQGHPMTGVVREVTEMRPRLEVLSSETSGVGAYPSQELRRILRESGRPPELWNFVATTAAKKTAGYGALLALMERGQLVLPRHPDLLRQFAGLRFNQGERGFTRIEAESAIVHDDVADAAMLATAPFVSEQARGRVVVKLLHEAAPNRAVPDAPVRSGDDVVTTAGGLNVWRRPPLQSVTGTATSSPGESWLPEPLPGSDEDVGRLNHIERKNGVRLLTRKTAEEIAAGMSSSPTTEA